MGKILATLLVITLLLASEGIAFASGYDEPTSYSSPHGGYANTTNKCKICHAVHLSEGNYRLTRANQSTDECDYCHNGTHTGAGVNVYRKVDPADPTNSILVDPVSADNGHTIGIALLQSAVPDRQATGSSSLIGTFTCLNCHSVHANNTLTGAYGTKIIKNDPDGDGSDVNPAGTYDNFQQTMTLFCSQCHNKNHGDASTYSHPTYKYDDPSTAPVCMHCHKGIGTPHTAYGVDMLDDRYDGTIALDGVCGACHPFDDDESHNSSDASNCVYCHNPSPPAGEELAPDILSLIQKKSHHPVMCTNCHKSSWDEHRNGTVEKYRSNGDAGYAMYLKANLTVPRLGDPVNKISYDKDDFELCYSCHSEYQVVGLGDGYDVDFRCYYTGPGGGSPSGYPLVVDVVRTNFQRIYDGIFVLDKHNWHWDHLNFCAMGPGAFPNTDTDLDGTMDSLETCTTCHNPHGSDNAALSRNDLPIKYSKDSFMNYGYISGFNQYTVAGGDVYCNACHGWPNAKYYRNITPTGN